MMFVRSFWFGMCYAGLQPEHISLQMKVTWSWTLAWDNLRMAFTMKFGIEMSEILSLCGSESF